MRLGRGSRFLHELAMLDDALSDMHRYLPAGKQLQLDEERLAGEWAKILTGKCKSCS